MDINTIQKERDQLNLHVGKFTVTRELIQSIDMEILNLIFDSKVVIRLLQNASADTLEYFCFGEDFELIEIFTPYDEIPQYQFDIIIRDDKQLIEWKKVSDE